MNWKKQLSGILSLKYNEKDAINGHSVDRYNYAIQLLNDTANDSMIKAYAWLSLAADEVDMKEKALILKHKIGFELKKKELFSEAEKLKSEYRSKHSAEAIIKRIETSRNPMNILLRLIFKLVSDTIKFVEIIDSKIIHENGSSFFWGIISAISSIVALFLFSEHCKTKILSVSVVILFFSSIISGCISEKRNESLKVK